MAGRRVALGALVALLWAGSASAETLSVAIVTFGNASWTQAQALATLTKVADQVRLGTRGRVVIQPVAIGPLPAIPSGCSTVETNAARIMRERGYEPLHYFRVIVATATDVCSQYAGQGGWMQRWAHLDGSLAHINHELMHTLGGEHNRDAYSMMSGRGPDAYEVGRMLHYLRTGSVVYNLPDSDKYEQLAWPEAPCFTDYGCDWWPSPTWVAPRTKGQSATIFPLEGVGEPVVARIVATDVSFLYAELRTDPTDFVGPRVHLTEASYFNDVGDLGATLRGILTPSAPSWQDCSKGLTVVLDAISATSATVRFVASGACPPPPPPPPPPACIPRGHSGKCR